VWAIITYKIGNNNHNNHSIYDMVPFLFICFLFFASKNVKNELKLIEKMGLIDEYSNSNMYHKKTIKKTAK
jgi:hypothetical protein